ncbi:MAG: hypothetical protein EBQ92_00435, partial [Proteobacteria bacterium]|nr:hypothetical protein [Pseudomonadota bacterium]
QTENEQTENEQTENEQTENGQNQLSSLLARLESSISELDSTYKRMITISRVQAEETLDEANEILDRYNAMYNDDPKYFEGQLRGWAEYFGTPFVSFEEIQKKLIKSRDDALNEFTRIDKEYEDFQTNGKLLSCVGQILKDVQSLVENPELNFRNDSELIKLLKFANENLSWVRKNPRDNLTYLFEPTKKVINRVNESLGESF